VSTKNSLIIGPDREGYTLVTDGGSIEKFGPDFELTLVEDGDQAANRLACPDSIIEPGDVNSHTHIYSALAPLGIPEPEPPPENFIQILERVWWRLDRALDADSLRASARLYAAESLLAGTTALIDHHESPNFIEGSLDVLADACQEIGIRAMLCYGATERNGGLEEGRRGLAECKRFIQSNRRSLVEGVCALHASFTVSDELIRETATLVEELGTITHVHVAEDLADNEDASQRGYYGPLERLLGLGALPPGSILAHCVHCNELQVQTADAQGLWIVQNPRSNRGNRVGYPMALGASDHVALGTDGYPARMADEFVALEVEATAHDDDLDVALARLPAGHRLAAERFGCSFVPLTPGGKADFVVRDNGFVRHVVVDGRLVVGDGELLTADLDDIRAEARDLAPRLWERMSAL
jgi:cytosine/adenosine deaminase-related metal-dependent hydrolase